MLNAVGLLIQRGCLLPGLSLGTARDDVQSLEEHDVLGQATVLRGACADVSGVVSGRGRARGLKEDRLGIPGREYAVRLGRARPEQQRRALFGNEGHRHDDAEHTEYREIGQIRICPHPDAEPRRILPFQP